MYDANAKLYREDRVYIVRGDLTKKGVTESIATF